MRDWLNSLGAERGEELIGSGGLTTDRPSGKKVLRGFAH